VDDWPDLEVIEAGEVLLARAQQTAQAIKQRVWSAMGAEGLSGPHAAAGAVPHVREWEDSTMLAPEFLDFENHQADRPSHQGSWELASFGVRREEDVADVAGAVATSMAVAGFPEDKVCGMRASLEKVLRSAVQGNIAGEVRVRYAVSPKEALAEIQDANPDRARARHLTLHQCCSAT
jgi:hypothetical protein